MTRSRRGHVHRGRAEAAPEWTPGEPGATGARAELGPGCPVFLRLGANVYDTRQARHELTITDLVALLDGPTHLIATIGRIETARMQPGLLLALSLAAALDMAVEDLTAGIFWNPGEVATVKAERRKPPEARRGFFSTIPAAMAAFEEPEGPGGSRTPARRRRRSASGSARLGSAGASARQDSDSRRVWSA